MPKAEKERILKEQAMLPKFENFSLVGYKLSRALEKNRKLAHLDLSFNSFKLVDVKVIGTFVT